MAETVDDGNFARAETNRMFAGLLASAPGLNQWLHHRDLAPLDNQTVIRMNRDTLYSLAVVDISAGATVTVPDAGDRYLSVMVVNQDHYINRIYHESGTYHLTVAEFDTPYVVLAARVLGNADDPDDLAPFMPSRMDSRSRHPRRRSSSCPTTTRSPLPRPGRCCWRRLDTAAALVGCSAPKTTLTRTPT